VALSKLATQLPEPPPTSSSAWQTATTRLGLSTARQQKNCTGSETTCSAATKYAIASTSRGSPSSRKVDTDSPLLRPGAVLLRHQHVSFASPPRDKVVQGSRKAIDDGAEGILTTGPLCATASRNLFFFVSPWRETYYSCVDQARRRDEPRRVNSEKLSARRQVLESGPTRAASTGSTRSSRSRGSYFHWPAIIARA